MLLGYNVTILAYGQTGSGKTHTMGTNFDGNIDDEIGVIPRAIFDIFDQIEEHAEYDFVITCSFIELYQEKLYDLLAQKSREQSVVDIRETSSKITVPNLTEIPVKSPEETIDCLMRASADRAVGATAMNSQSSRSHAIFAINVMKTHRINKTDATTAKFNLVDLAGSERSKKTLATGEQFKEGVKINQGLLVLGNVISALGSAGHNPGHVGYRDSKLTRLLQESLGGNSITLMIACVSPADYNMDETIGTLRYADRAKKIKNKPIVNQDPTKAEINRLKAEIQTLRLELLSNHSDKVIAVEQCKECKNPPTKMQLLKQLREMGEKLQITLCDIAHRENIITEYEDTIESLNEKIDELKTQITTMNEIITSEMTEADMVKYKENVQIISETISNLTHHMNDRKECILESSKASESLTMNNSTSSLAEHEDEVAETNDTYIKKQTSYQTELKEIKAQLAMKEELHKKLFSNFQQFCSYDVNHGEENKMHDYEETITKLEKEKEELKELLRSKNNTVSVKLAEERRKRVQQLETEINDIRKKNKQQAQLLKQREKDNEKIKKLNNEIGEMKQLKVKLIRKMKSESEEFRQWRQKRDREVAQLRAKDRKMQSDAAKKQVLHDKQLCVLKRKAEEANSVAKRYKDALQKQKNSKSNKSTNNSNGTNQNKAAWINGEVEIIMSIVDMKQSLDQLSDVRAELNKRLKDLKKTCPDDKQQINAVQEEIEMRNAQINDIASKISENDLDSKIKNVYETCTSLPESKAVIKCLLNDFIDLRSNFNNYFAQARDQKNINETLEDRMKQLEKELKEMNGIKRTELNHIEKEHEEKTAMLLKVLTSNEKESELVPILEKELAIKDLEIKKLKEMIEKNGKRKTESRKKLPTLEMSAEMFDDSLDLEVEDEDDSDDPEWRKTPMYKREKRTLTVFLIIIFYNESLINIKIKISFSVHYPIIQLRINRKNYQRQMDQEKIHQYPNVVVKPDVNYFVVVVGTKRHVVIVVIAKWIVKIRLMKLALVA